MRIQTEIGLLPEDWKVVRLEDVGSFSKGAGISRSEASSGRIPAVRYGEIYTDHDNYIKRFRSFISSEIAKQSRRMKKGCLLFAASGETKEDIGKAVAFIDDFEAYAGGDLIILNPKGDIVSLYLGYTLNSPVTVRQRAMQAQGDSVVHITTGAIQNIAIPLPPKPEQERIAAALTSIDSLIDNLERTIQKKKHIREGAMEELLSGKRRLPGFSGEWVEKKLSDILQYEQPGAYLVQDTKYYSAGIPVLTVGKTFILGYTQENDGVFTNIPIIIFDDFTTESRYVNFEFKVKSSAVKMLHLVDDSYDLRFISEKMKAINFTPYDHQRYWIGTYSQFRIMLPPTIHEQHAIADTLTALDDEIALLQAERDKYLQIRSGMMDDLLTGKIRLQ